MGLGSTGISTRFISRQTSEPANPVDGFLWINPEGGANGNNTERYIWNKSAGAWELTNSVGPDSPNYATTGALWRDTANGQQKVYDGAAWQNVGVTDHANLTNVQANQHHTPPSASDPTTADVTASRSYGTTYQNTTGSPLLVKVRIDSGDTRLVASSSDSGVTTSFNSGDRVEDLVGQSRSLAVAVIPDGWYYGQEKYDTADSVAYWYEQVTA